MDSLTTLFYGDAGSLHSSLGYLCIQNVSAKYNHKIWPKSLEFLVKKNGKARFFEFCLCLFVFNFIIGRLPFVLGHCNHAQQVGY